VGSTNASDIEDFDFHVSQFEVDAVASISSLNQDSTLSLYPNPVQGDVVYMSINSMISMEYHVAIYNNLGQQVLEAKLKPESNRLRIEGLDHLESGIYFVKVQSSDVESTIKLIKN
jgi:hypothetical protein